MKIKNVWRRFLVWLGVLKLKPEAEIKRLLDQAIRVEEQHECNHRFLVSLFPEGQDRWYKCSVCNQVWIITEAMQIKADKMPLLIKRLQQVIKMKPKNRKIIEKAVDKSE